MNLPNDYTDDPNIIREFDRLTTEYVNACRNLGVSPAYIPWYIDNKGVLQDLFRVATRRISESVGCAPFDLLQMEMALIESAYSKAGLDISKNQEEPLYEHGKAWEAYQDLIDAAPEIVDDYIQDHIDGGMDTTYDMQSAHSIRTSIMDIAHWFDIERGDIKLPNAGA